jgi:protein involved in polysaccharide export with SLBB domain
MPWLSALVLLNGLLSGCAAVSNPVANGVPVRLLPPELQAEPREDKRTIPLTALRQKPPDSYRLAPGDVVGVWIEGVLGQPDQLPPVMPTTTGGRIPPAIGLPITVREDGTIPVPLVKPVQVKDLTLPEAEAAVRKAYTQPKKEILKEGARFIVTLVRPRQYHVLVFRQDSGGLTLGASGVIGSTKRGTGFALDLPAYENDVLNALAASGGLPGLDAVNEILIERDRFNVEQDPAALLHAFESAPPGCNPLAAVELGRSITRIPVRMRPGEPLPFRPEEVVLRTGDIVFIEARDTEVWYSGGLMLPAEHVLPRDRDLDVLQAVSQAGLPLVNGGVTLNNLSGSITSTGLGFPSPSLLSVIRRTPNGGQVVIRVDLNRALTDPRERLLIRAGDLLIYQETPAEAFARYIIQKFSLNATWQYLHGKHESGTISTVIP